MKRAAGFKRRRLETTLALINVVFLMLVFFMVAGRIAASAPEGMTLVQFTDAAPPAPPDTLAVLADGRTIWNGAETDPAAYLAARMAQGGADAVVARIMPDRAVPAETLIALARDLSRAGATSVRIVAQETRP